MVHSQWYNFLEEYIPSTPYRFDDSSSSSCCVLDDYLQCKNNLTRKRLQKQQQQQQQVKKGERGDNNVQGNNNMEEIIMNCSDSELNIYLAEDTSTFEQECVDVEGERGGGGKNFARSRTVGMGIVDSFGMDDDDYSSSSSSSSSSSDSRSSSEEGEERQQHQHQHQHQNPLASFAEFSGGEAGLGGHNVHQHHQQQSITPPKTIPTVLASYAEFLPDEPPSSSIRRISFTSPFAENKSNNLSTAATASAAAAGGNLSPSHPPSLQLESNLSMSPPPHATSTAATATTTTAKEEHQHAFDTLMSLAEQQQQQQLHHQQQNSSSITRSNDHHVRFQLSSDDLTQDQIDDTQEGDEVNEVEETISTTLMSAGEPSSEGGSDTLDGSGRSGVTSTSRSSSGGDSSNSSSGQFSSDVSSGSRFEQPSTTSSSSSSSSSSSCLDKIDEEGVVPASPSSYKELMKMPYVRRNSNPVESDEDFSKIEDDEEREGVGGGELGVGYSKEKENVVELSSSPPRVGDDAVDSTNTFATSSSSTSPHLVTTATTEKSQNSSWSVADESSSTSTGDGNKIAIRNCRNNHEFNKAIRGKDEQSSVVRVRQQNRTQLEEHIEKGARGGPNKTISVDGDATTVVASPRKNNAKGNNNASKKKSVKQRGGDNSKVDVIFPRAYSRNSGSKGIRFRERFVYNWDDGLYENLTIEEKTPIHLEGSADVAAGTVRSTVLKNATVDTRAEGIDTETIEDAKEDGPVTNEEGDDNISPLPHPDVYERNDTYGSLKTTATVTTADSTVFSRMSSTFSHEQEKESSNAHTFSSMKSFLSQSQIRHLEDAPPELTDILNEQLRILKSRRKDILERATLRDRTQADISVEDTIQMENSIQFSLFVMKDKVEQLQNILGPLNIDVSDPMMKSVFSDSSGDESSGACSAVTESSDEGISSQFRDGGVRLIESVNVN